jgi:hypothetical protein
MVVANNVTVGGTVSGGGASFSTGVSAASVSATGVVSGGTVRCTNALITAQHGTAQAITTVSSVIRWSTAIVNRGGIFTLNGSTGQITVSEAGTYHVCADVYLSTSTNPQVALEAQVNGGVQRRSWAACISCYLVLAANDVVTIGCFHNTSGSSFNTATAASHTWVQIYKAG